MVQATFGKEIEKRLTWEIKSVWDKSTEEEKKTIFAFGEQYKEFLNQAKTEREAVEVMVARLKAEGYKDLGKKTSQGLKPGDKFYIVNRNKMLIAGVLGTAPLTDGVRIVGSHVDAPRLDGKPNPIYESNGFALFKTHYYGGIKKYQWPGIPLALHGVIITANGEKLTLTIGEEPEDPVFTITDLLPHLAKDQMKKTMAEGVAGESLNLLLANIPHTDTEVKDRVKLAVLEYLADKYGLIEEDFVSAEIEIVPASQARDVGLDRSMVGFYGQDDRVCVFASLEAILATNKPRKTALALFSDKEEIGSMGNTGAQSRFLEYTIAKLCARTQLDGIDTVLEVLTNSEALSADTTAAIDPNYQEVSDKQNGAELGKGIVITKYTGARGKYDANDAHAEYVGKIRSLLNEAGVVWQIGELGKVDQGGGGTIAQYLANQGIETVDCGPALLGLHSPFEVASKADLYMAYKGYKAFFEQ
jgi:aspartyl aminopeptidase